MPSASGGGYWRNLGGPIGLARARVRGLGRRQVVILKATSWVWADYMACGRPTGALWAPAVVNGRTWPQGAVGRGGRPAWRRRRGCGAAAEELAGRRGSWAAAGPERRPWRARPERCRCICCAGPVRAASRRDLSLGASACAAPPGRRQWARSLGAFTANKRARRSRGRRRASCRG